MCSRAVRPKVNARFSTLATAATAATATAAAASQFGAGDPPARRFHSTAERYMNLVAIAVLYIVFN